MPMERGQYPELFQLDLDTQTALSMLDSLTDTTYDEHEPEYTQIYNVDTGDGTGRSDKGLGGIGLPQQADGEFGGLNYDDVGQWFQQSYVYVTFNKGYLVSHDIMEDDSWGMAQHRARMLGQVFRWLPEVMGARLFNEGFSAQTPGSIGNLGRRNPDGVALFSTAHPNPGPGGGVQSNRPASGGADLSHASLEAMQIRMGAWTNDRGMPIRNPMQRLYVPQQLRFRAEEILSSSFRTDTLKRVKNVFKDIEIIVGYYLTNPRAWFGLGSKSQTQLNWIDREKPNRSMWIDKETRGVHVGCWTRFDFGYSMWLGISGDPGLGG